jgi:hypothetical protein
LKAFPFAHPWCKAVLGIRDSRFADIIQTDQLPEQARPLRHGQIFSVPGNEKKEKVNHLRHTKENLQLCALQKETIERVFADTKEK